MRWGAVVLAADLVIHTMAAIFVNPSTRGDLTHGLSMAPGLDEVARVRKHPEQYEPWHIALVEDARAALAERTRMYDYDCGACGHAVLVKSLTDPCRNCGAV